MKLSRILRLGGLLLLSASLVAPGVSALAADTGSRADVAAIRALLTITSGRCPQAVGVVAVSGRYALASVTEHGACDIGYVRVLTKFGSRWRATSGIGGVPDACTVHSKGIPLADSVKLVRALTGTNNASLTSTSGCR